MGFNADTVVQKLEWNFRPHVEASGVSPEPSTEKVGAFFDQLHIILERPDGEETVPSNIAAMMAAMSTSQLAYADEKLIAAYADLLGDCPNAEQIGSLPHRTRLAFFGYVTGQVTDPS